jgi:hypothetical protein
VSPRPGAGPTAGYSSKPLASKRGLRSGTRVLTVSAPERYRRLLGELPDGVRLSEQGAGPFDVVHLFVTTRATLAARLAPLVRRIMRAVARPLELVDVKVRAVDDTWSGLKLVLRLANRPR